ncbi:hypothetical protein UPYG_G00014530 [Umbra pygmaea]|uniref:Tyrosine-protein phosphatase non-receptor type 20 n=1 Tax=Umbra pygmaea TaxID=75934 RepID=A0ABD0XMH2_UMBPY
MSMLSRAQILQEFSQRFRSLAAKDNSGFWQEFEDLDNVGKQIPARVGNLEANRDKNRYHQIVPYDHCRVRLSLQNSQPHSDYINASYVPGGCTQRDFICTQGPLRSTMSDFWRMIWEQKVRIIVMVTALKHEGMVLCDEYWPQERGTVLHGIVQVTTLFREQGPDYLITTIHLRQRDCFEERTVTHYYYSVWPDMGVPKELSSLCALTEHVRQHLDTLPLLGPTVVHCSAGVGRTGTFVTLLWLMQLCMRGVMPDVRAAVEDLRRRRVMMVQNLKQYILIYQCLMQWLGGGDLVHPLSSAQSPAYPPHLYKGHLQHYHSSKKSSRGNRSRKSREHQEQHTPQAAQTQARTQSSLKQLLNPGNLLRRLLPPSKHKT